MRSLSVAAWLVAGFLLGAAATYYVGFSRGDARDVPETAGTTAARAEEEAAAALEESGPVVADETEEAGGEDAHGPEHPVGTVGAVAGAVGELRERELIMPVEGIDPEDLHQSFDETRGTRRHEALDILAPRDTPVRAVEEGTIAKLFASDRGGLTIYHFDPTGKYCYYYAHLERYAEGLREGQRVEAGEVIGYVGTSGNAPRDTPHLHFAIFALGPEKRWWEGTPIDPYLVLR